MGVDRVENKIAAGAYYSVGLSPDSLTRGYVTTLQSRAQMLKDFIQAGGDLDSDPALGEKLYLTAMTYLWETDYQANVIENHNGMVCLKQPGEAIFSLSLTVDMLFGVPRSASVSGLNIDVDRVIYSPISKKGDSVAELNFMNDGGITGSNTQHGIIEQVYRVGAWRA